MPARWSENGICKTCQGQGFVKNGGTSFICPSCRGKKAARNSKALRKTTINPVCPICGGLRYIKTCCGQPRIPCYKCEKDNPK